MNTHIQEPGKISERVIGGRSCTKNKEYLSEYSKS